MTTEKTTEPLWWGLFSAGGVVAAFLVPIHIILVGFAVPLGWISDSGALYRIWWVKLYLFVLIVLPLYHWAHRFYFTLNDMGLKPMNKPSGRAVLWRSDRRNGCYSVGSVKGMTSSEPSF